MTSSIKNGLAYALALAFCAAALSLSATQLTVQSAAKAPNCADLLCESGSDCGTKCFCNGPSSSCVVDE